MKRSWIIAGLMALMTTHAVATDLVLYNGNLITMDPRQPQAQAIAISGERIVSVGSNADVLKTAGKNTRRIDLEGRTVVPGINDAHQHADWDLSSIKTIELPTLNPDWDMIQAALKEKLATDPEATGLRIIIFGTATADTRIHRNSLDAISSTVPIWLASAAGHFAILNSPALASIGVDETIVDPAGGAFERDGSNRLTGVLREYAAWIATKKRTALEPDRTATRQLKDFLNYLPRLGVTSIQTMPLPDVQRYIQLLSNAQSPIRVRVISFNGTDANGLIPAASVPRSPAPMIHVSGQKWVLDGVLEGGLTPRDQMTARLLEPGGPYSIAALSPLLTLRQVEQALGSAKMLSQQPIFHVFGQKGAEQLLTALDATGGPTYWKSRRVRIEHGEGITAAMIPHANAYGLIVSQQGAHMSGEHVNWRQGGEVLAKGQLLKTLLAGGLTLALGSDGPPNPWLGMMLVVQHPNRPEERITRYQALHAYTMGSAYAEFAEHHKGSLEKGKLADLAVLSQDIMSVPLEKLPATTSVLTLIGGNVVWQDETIFH